jgi:ferredoxin-like protein FixX
MAAKAWLDEDGQHIWLQHDCKSKRDTSMLPYPTWQATDDGKKVQPSINCMDCGLHTFVPITGKSHA